MGSFRPQNQKYNQTIDGSAPSPKSGLDPTQPIDPATKHTVRQPEERRRQSGDAAAAAAASGQEAAVVAALATAVSRMRTRGRGGMRRLWASAGRGG